MKGALFAMALSMMAIAPSIPTIPQNVHDPLTDPWGQYELEALAEPLMKARRVSPEAGAAAVEQKLAQVPDDAEERARILTAYGVELLVAAGWTPPTAGKLEALPYMRRAMEEGRSAFRSDSPMLATLLADAAVAEFLMRGPATPEEAETWLEEAHAIRTESLGTNAPETVLTLVNLAEIRGQPSRLEGDPARIHAVSRLYESLLRADPADQPSDYDFAYLSWMRFLVRASRPHDACAVFQKAQGLSGRLQLNMAFIAAAFAETLRESGHASLAADLAPPFFVGEKLLEVPAEEDLECSR